MRKACGSRTIARPIATRWRWPPERWRGRFVQHLGEPEEPRGVLDAPPDLRPVDAAHLEPERHVVVDVHVRVERVVLEDHRDVARLRRQVVHDLVADAHRAGGDVLEAGDHAERARLAAAGRADEDDELAVGDLQVELVHRPGPVGVDLRQPVELDGRHGPEPYWRRIAARSS